MGRGLGGHWRAQVCHAWCLLGVPQLCDASAEQLSPPRCPFREKGQEGFLGLDAKHCAHVWTDVPPRYHDDGPKLQRKFKTMKYFQWETP